MCDASPKFEWQTRGSNYTLKLEYYNGAWTELTANTNDLDDDTSNFQSDGKISWTIPDDWSTVAVNSITKYWIRISTTTDPVTTAEAYYIIPGDSVIGLLALSSTEISNEEWKWCSYTTAIYVTIRNTGNTAYEGNYYIASASSTTNKQNFFCWNHQYLLDHQDSTYDPVVTKTSSYTATGDEGTICLDSTDDEVRITLPACADVEEGKILILKCLTSVSGFISCVDGSGTETIDGQEVYNFSSDYECITIQNTGSEWIIIGKV